MAKKFHLKKAPLVEMLLGVQFGNNSFLSLPTIFSFYNENKSIYPIIQEHPVTPSVIEHINNPPEIIFMSGIQSRKFFISSDETKLIQFQLDRMNLNWRKRNETDAYPRFNSIYSEFSGLYSKLGKTSKSTISINQYEMAYVNHIPFVEFQNSPTEIFATLQLPSIFGNINLTYTTPVNEMGGNITVIIQKGTRMDKNEEIILFQLSLRGFSDKITMSAWFDRAHDLLIEKFNKLVTEEAKNKWEIEK